MLVIVSVRVSVPVTTVTSPSPPAADDVVISTESLGPVKIVGVDMGLKSTELVIPEMRLEEAPIERTGRSDALLKVLHVLVLLEKSKVLLDKSNTASSMQPLHAPGM